MKPLRYLEKRIQERGRTELDGISLANMSLSFNPDREYSSTSGEKTLPFLKAVWKVLSSEGWEKLREFHYTDSVASKIPHFEDNQICLIWQIPRMVTKDLPALVASAQADLRALSEMLPYREPGLIYFQIGTVIMKWVDLEQRQ